MLRLLFNNFSKKSRDKESGVSEIVSVVILISIVVVGMSIIAVMLLSSPLPEKIPKIDVQYTNTTEGANFANMGGDALKKDQIIIRAIYDNQSYTNYTSSNISYSNNTTSLFESWPNGSSWGYGSFTRVPNNPMTKAYQIIYKGQQGEYLLKEFNRAAWGGGDESGGSPSNCSLDSSFTWKYGTDVDSRTIILNPGSYSATIQFNASNQTYTSNQGYKWGWVFSDGGESSDLNTQHTFTIPSTGNASYPFTVTHWVANNQYYNCTTNTGKQITIYPYYFDSGCTLDFNTSLSCRHASFSGYTTCQDPLSWNYTISGVSGALDGKDVSKDFDTDGSYDITATITYYDETSNLAQKSTLHTIDVDCCKLVPSFTATESPSGSGYYIFTDISTIGSGTISAWNWEFGDGSVSTEQNPTHQYTTCGSKTVNLTVTAGTACGSETVYKDISISTIPITADFSFTRDSANYFSYTFTNTSTSAADITSWIWKFSDDGSTQTGESVSHTYTSEGYYTVTLTTTNSCGVSSTITKTIHVVQFCPNITAGFDFTTDASAITATFQDTSYDVVNITGWRWDFGDGESVVWNKAQWTANSSGKITHQYAELAPYTAKFTVSNDCGHSDQIYKLIFSGSCGEVHADFTPVTSSVNAGNSITFHITNPANATHWYWSYGDGTYEERTDSNDVYHAYTKSGTYTVSLRAINDCGSTDTKLGTVIVACYDVFADFTFQQIIDKQNNYLRVNFTDTSYNSSNISTWRWDFGDGNYTIWNKTLWSEAFGKVSHLYPQLAPYTAKLTVGNDCGASNYTYKLIYNGTPCSEVLANFSPLYVEDKAPREVTFIDLTPNATKWVWNFGDGYSSETQNPTHLFNSSGRFTVSLTATNGCGLSGTKTGTVNLSCPNASASFGYDYLALDRSTNNLTVQFNDTSNNYGKSNITQWTWTFGDGAKTTWDKAAWQAAAGKIVHKYPEVAPYTAILEIANECGSTDWTSRLVNNGTCNNISVNFSPLVSNGTPPLSISFVSHTTNVTSWFWNFGDGYSSEEQNPTHIYNQSGLFAVTLTGYNSCGLSKQKTGSVNVTCPSVTADYGYQYLAANVTTNNLTVRFSDISQGHGSNITQWTWDFGDGNTTSWNQTIWQATSGQITHKFPEVIPYLVGLTVQNACGSTDKVQKLIYNGTTCPEVIANFSPLSVNDSAPNTISFTDLTTGSPNRWHWDFGDGYFTELIKNSTVSSGNTSHTYNLSGHYMVTLIASSECGNAGVKSGYVDLTCPNVSVDFGYIHIDQTNNTVNFTAYVNPPIEDSDILEWTWFFGDGATGNGQSVTHTYGVGTEDTTFNVLLVVKSYCGSIGQNLKLIYPYCPNLTPRFNVTPTTGTAPLTVSFTENSNATDVISWRWFFGDGNYSYTTDPNSRVPPNHTYYNWGIYYITEQLQNKCGNLFNLIKSVTVTSPVSFTGHIWDDLNFNGRQDSGEWDLSNWNVTLQEKVNGVWTNKTTVKTNTTGWYTISRSDISYGIFRLVEDLPAIWNVTTSYGVTRSGPDKTATTGTMLVYTTRNYRADFGNVDWHVSSMQLPQGYWQSSGGYFRVDQAPRYWGYSTSFDLSESQIQWYQTTTRNNVVVFQVPPYGRWGNSSFSLTPTPYSAYIITVTNNGATTCSISYTDWIERWVYNGKTYLGKSFSVPDNTSYYGDLLSVYMINNNTPYTDINPPYEGQTIPYDQHFGAFNGQYNFSCHVTGTGTNINTTLKTPVSQVLRWNSSWAYFTVDWDNRLFEGQNITFTTESSFHSPTNAVIRAHRNVSVDFEPLTPSFINITTDFPTQGNITVNAHVGGHNYDKNNVSVVVGNVSTGIYVIPMTWTNGNGAWEGGWNNSTTTFYSEQMAGKVVPMVIRATPMYDNGRLRGKIVDSSIVYVTIKSKNPIQANFTADPNSGPAPLEVAFTDTSIGGPSRWDWNFGDGTANITGSTINEKNPIHVFNQTGTFPVTLTVWNITNYPSSYRQNITIANSWHTTNLFTSRTGSLAAGGYARWMVSGSGSTITVNGIPYSLKDGDVVQLSLLSSLSTARILISGSITAFDCSNVQLTVNGINLQQGACTAINIQDFNNFHSNMALTTTKDTSAWVNFIWDGASVLIPTTRNLAIYDLMPKSRYMDINLQSGQIYFDGNASQYLLYR